MIDRILQGDVRACLQQIEANSVQCCITSPPYWGLRDYGTAVWEGGDPNCDHKQGTARNDGGRVNVSGFHGSSASNSDKGAMNYVGVCPKCGARRIDHQIGLEPTPEAYVADLVEVFREVKRVLRNDGTLWLNLGDSYAGSGKGGQSEEKRSENWQPTYTNKGNVPYGCKPKDLVGIPWRVAFALQADGWYLRSDIIWAKPNPMPESVTDRCTKSHEYIFMLSKSGEPQLWAHRDRAYKDCVYVEPEPDYRWLNNITKQETAIEPAGWQTLTYIVAGKEMPLWTRRNLWRGCDYFYDNEAIKEPANPNSDMNWARTGPVSNLVVPGHTAAQHRSDRQSVERGGFNGKTNQLDGREAFRAVTDTRNKRDVWTVATQPCTEAHFATFPPKLIEPMILAGSKEGDTVLDPFMGSGTTAIQCVRLHRHYLGCELNPEYVAMANRRIADMVGPLFAQEAGNDN